MKYAENKIYTVSEYISSINIGLKNFRLKMIGEVSSCKVVPSGHVYFTLKDETDGSLINCIIWRSRYTLFGVDLEEGMKVIVLGNSEIYAPQGKFSFIADTIEVAGEGALKKEYEKLKTKLIAEGIFEESRKKPIPKYIRKIGIITSLRAGVVMADFMNNLGQFGFEVKMMDARVEGQEAVVSLLSAVKSLRKQDIEALVIMRGGGSLESMMAFNNETLIRQIINFPVPVIAAIGHDVDVPLLALACDHAVSTPTAAANYLSESWEESALLLERYERRIFNNYKNLLDNTNALLNNSIDTIRKAGNLITEKYKRVFNRLMIAIHGFKNTIQNIKNNIDSSCDKILSGLELQISKMGQQLQHAERLVSSNNPERQLRLGYSIVVCDGKVIRSIKDVNVGSNINLKVSDGTIASEVKNISNK